MLFARICTISCICFSQKFSYLKAQNRLTNSIQNLKLSTSSAEHENSFITLRPGFLTHIVFVVFQLFLKMLINFLQFSANHRNHSMRRHKSTSNMYTCIRLSTCSAHDFGPVIWGCIILFAQINQMQKIILVLFLFHSQSYRINSMYWDRQVSANSADQDQTASEEAV